MNLFGRQKIRQRKYDMFLDGPFQMTRAIHHVRPLLQQESSSRRRYPE
jgi:hypothetical protein